MDDAQKLLDEIYKARKSGKDLDPGISPSRKESSNEGINSALGLPKGTVIKSAPMPMPNIDPNRMIDTPFGKVRQGDIEYRKKGGKVSSASKRADGCATKGKTRGRMV